MSEPSQDDQMQNLQNPQREFLFVDLQHSAFPHRASNASASQRTMIRSHVVRDYSRRRKREAHQSLQASKRFLQALRPANERADQNETDQLSEVTSNSPEDSLGVRPMTTQGANRIDPFQGALNQVEDRQYLELVDYCIKTLWKGLRGTDYAYNFAREWLPVYEKNPAAKHVFMYTASLHSKALHGTGEDSQRDLRMQLFHKGEAARLINQDLNDELVGYSDELICNILFLGVVEVGRLDDPGNRSGDPSPFSPLLKSAQWLDLYGVRDWHATHWMAVLSLVEMRGGLKNIKMYGLPWLLSFAALLFATATLTKPRFPYLDPDGQECVFNSLTSPVDSGFRILRNLGFEEGLVIALLDLQNFSATLEAYSCDRLPQHMLESLLDSRNIVQHRLLSLPSIDETSSPGWDDLFSQKSRQTLLVYESCRLAANLYSIHVVYPIPCSKGPRTILVEQLKRALEQIVLLPDRPDQTKSFLWCTVLGGIAAANDTYANGLPEQSWFSARSMLAGVLLGIRDWRDVRAILQSFAWLGVACDDAGVVYWEDVYPAEMMFPQGRS